MKKSLLIITSVLASVALQAQDFKVTVDTSAEPMEEGPFSPTVKGLSGFTCPDWFRDAKFGIWAHWGPQCQPENGDWYGRIMYIEGEGQYKHNIELHGHPSEFGFKDWIHEWKAENWNPDSLVHFYQECGAKYFFTLANHHDNFDLYDSRYQQWNSINLGPQKDIVGGWEKAARKYGLRFGVSVHASHAWVWYETAKGHDTKGPFAGVPYDGWLTKEDGKGTWWEGYDIQDLYEQRHPLSKDNGAWQWEEDKVTTPDQAYCDRLYNRTVDLIDKYNPDIIYFDDVYLPLWPVSDAGLKIAAHMYNRSANANGGVNQGVITGKGLSDEQKQTILWDVERGAPADIQPLPWQTCTCIGSWHYDKWRYYNDRYKSSRQVIRMLVDIVSKNGNLLLSVPLRGDGTPDPTEIRIVGEIGQWLEVNGESIYGTRPWKLFGEGPSTQANAALNTFGFNEGKEQYSSSDLRFTCKGDKTIFVTVMSDIEGQTVISSLGRKSGCLRKARVRSVQMLGSSEKLNWKQEDDALVIEKPTTEAIQGITVFKVSL